MPKLSVIEASGNESERGSRARTERDAARRALTERHALAATERETALAKRVEELTAERDELRRVQYEAHDRVKVDYDALKVAHNRLICDRKQFIEQIDALQNGDAFKVENETLRAQVALLTKERDAALIDHHVKVTKCCEDEKEVLRSRITDLLAARNVADCDLQRVVPRMEAAETERDELRIRLDELRRVIAELVRK